MAQELLTCTNGEINVSDIIDAVNELIESCNGVVDCCEKYSQGDVIRTYVVGNVMYMTNDGSDPHP